MTFIRNPSSLNTYFMGKVWFRASSEDLRAENITVINSKSKSRLY